MEICFVYILIIVYLFTLHIQIPNISLNACVFVTAH